MTYNFDERVERRGTDCLKWDAVGQIYGPFIQDRDPSDILPLWVADMDIKPPREIAEAVEARAAHNVYGYTKQPDDLPKIVQDWVRRHYHLEIETSDFVFCPGIVPAIGVALRANFKLGDGVIILSPVYGPFAKTIQQNEMEVQSVPLINDGERWSIDWEALEAAVKENTRCLLFCSPHNPVGRIWNREELEKMADFVKRHDLLLISDEIHADFQYDGHELISPATLPEMAERTITCYAPSKTFSVAGLMASAIIISEPELREKFKTELARSGLHGNLFGYLAMRAAWLHGEEWLRQLLVYLQDNRDYLLSEIEKLKAHGISAIKPESTYLLFLDCRKLMAQRGWKTQAELMTFMLSEAGICPNSGTEYGPEGEGYVRLNFGCPRSILEEAMTRLREALERSEK